MASEVASTNPELQACDYRLTRAFTHSAPSILSASGAEGRRFESCSGHYKTAGQYGFSLWSWMFQEALL